MKEPAAEAQFGLLYAACADAVFRYFCARTSDREVALDLTQDVFVRCWNTILSGKEIRNHRAFVFAIARNLVIDWYRKKKTLSLEALTEKSAGARAGSSDADLFFLIDGKEEGFLYQSAEVRFLTEKIQELDSVYQEVVYLRLVEELPPRDIAVILGLSVNVVSVRVNRGIKKLRTLTGYEKNE